jgi:release factor glutamine methyltransferase
MITTETTPSQRSGSAIRLTIEETLSRATASLSSASDTPRADAETLLVHLLSRDRSYFRAWPERTLPPEVTARFDSLIDRRAKGEPVAYLCETREFWSLPFKVRRGVLIPRPETELLVELALAIIPADQRGEIADLGTGSGAIGVSIAKERPQCRVFATDLSPEALAVARENAALNSVRNMRFALGDWFAAVPDDQLFDLVVSNPPYIADRDSHLDQGDLRFEPRMALVSGPHGLDAITRIVDQCRSRLKPGGQLLLEHGYRQAHAVAEILGRFGYSAITAHPDLQGHWRAMTASWPGSSGSIQQASPCP